MGGVLIVKEFYFLRILRRIKINFEVNTHWTNASWYAIREVALARFGTIFFCGLITFFPH